MPDTISQYRQARLVIHLPRAGRSVAQWTLTAEQVTRGVPDATLIAHGEVPGLGPSPSRHEVWKAILDIAEAEVDA